MFVFVLNACLQLELVTDLHYTLYSCFLIFRMDSKLPETIPTSSANRSAPQQGSHHTSLRMSPGNNTRAHRLYLLPSGHLIQETLPDTGLDVQPQTNQVPTNLEDYHLAEILTCPLCPCSNSCWLNTSPMFLEFNSLMSHPMVLVPSACPRYCACQSSVLVQQPCTRDM